jgi:hypothetical protein
MSGKHSTPMRGLMSTKKSPLFSGAFGRMFRSLRPATFGDTDDENIAILAKLGRAMSAPRDPGDPKDGRDDEESGIPSLYTYFGQFIDHDLTFDPNSTLQKHNDPDALVDFRTPAFDLDNVYGRGPDDQPYMYDGNMSFLLGEKLDGGDSDAADLPRNNAMVRRALIGDPRNDENTIVSQLQGLFHRFHNRTVKDYPQFDFGEVQKLVRFHYQYIILNDFLPRIVHSSVISALKIAERFDARNLQFFHWKHETFMPVEFSVAAYRLGHSMIRPGYRLNDNVLLPIFPVPAGNLNEGLTGFRAMNTHWGIDWGRFIDVDVRTYDGTLGENKRRLQFAYRLDTSIVNPLETLPSSVAENPNSLAQRNLERAWRLGIPSGQDVARAMHIEPLNDSNIFIGKGTEVTDPDATPITAISAVFANNCPLWTYILAESMQSMETVKLPVVGDITVKMPRLGPVGGRIVGEVFLGLMFGDSNSMLSLAPDWQPKSGPNYALKDFVNYALGR